MSLFDEKLPYGWNLRDLGCLLKQPHIPQVPGVTTPMTYFGMWKSFFAWHVVSSGRNCCGMVLWCFMIDCRNATSSFSQHAASVESTRKRMLTCSASTICT
jgi:hypothetical protein